jgi:hypothetical protein
MRSMSNAVLTSGRKDRQLSLATFKNSLRAWQAGYKARQGPRTSATAKPHNEAPRA